MQHKTRIKELLEERLVTALSRDDVSDGNLKLALDYLKVFKVDDTAEESAFRIPRKGVLKEFADRVPGGSA